MARVLDMLPNVFPSWASRYLSLPRVELCLSEEQLLKLAKSFWFRICQSEVLNKYTHGRTNTHTHHSHKYWYYNKHNLWPRLQHAWGVERTWLDRRSRTTFTTGALSNYDLPPLPAEWTMTTYWPRSDPHAIWLYLFNQLYLMSHALNLLLRSVIMEVIGGMWHSVFMWRKFNVLFFTLRGVKLMSHCGKIIRNSWGYFRTDVCGEYVELRWRNVSSTYSLQTSVRKYTQESRIFFPQCDINFTPRKVELR